MIEAYVDGTADLPVFQLLDQGRLGVAGRRPGGVLGRGQFQRGQRVALGQRRQPALPVVPLGVVVGVLHVGLEEPVEADDLAGGAELGFLAGRGPAGDPDRHRLAGGVLHLRGDRALPDQLVQPELVAGQAGLRRACGTGPRPAGSPRAPPGRSSPCWCRRGARPARTPRPYSSRAWAPGRGDRRLRQRDRVGPHIGDVAVLVQPLRHATSCTWPRSRACARPPAAAWWCGTARTATAGRACAPPT